MNPKLFSEAMSEVNDKYYEEAANYQCKKYGWGKWTTVAACLVLVCVAAISLFTGNNDEITTTPGIADAPPMVYVNNTLYKQSTKQTSYSELKNDFIYLGIIESDITNSQGTNDAGKYLDGIPKENFQANHPIVGAKVYQYGNNIVVEIEEKYWLYEQYKE